jgi:hypothetical protein
MTSAAAHAKTTVVTLPQLVSESEIIVYGHVSSSVEGASKQSATAVKFNVEQIFKGRGHLAARNISLCNLPDEYSDKFDLSKLTGDFILFVSRKEQCFELSHGDRAVGAVKDGRAHTAAIEDQPDDQPLGDVSWHIQTLVTAAALSERSVPANDKQAQFVRLASDAAKSHDAKAFASLYCDPSKRQPVAAASIFRSFSGAYAGTPRQLRNPPETFPLFVCFESTESKEMCQVFSVGQIGSKLCILDDRAGKHT